MVSLFLPMVHVLEMQVHLSKYHVVKYVINYRAFSRKSVLSNVLLVKPKNIFAVIQETIFRPSRMNLAAIMNKCRQLSI